MDLMAKLLDEMSAATLTEGEVKLLLMTQVHQAILALDAEKYGMAKAFLEDAVGHARSLIIMRGSGK